MRKPKQSISQIMIGDTLAELVSRLDTGDGEARVIVLALNKDGSGKLAYSEGINQPELLGALYMTIDRLAQGGKE